MPIANYPLFTQIVFIMPVPPPHHWSKQVLLWQLRRGQQLWIILNHSGSLALSSSLVVQLFRTLKTSQFQRSAAVLCTTHHGTSKRLPSSDPSQIRPNKPSQEPRHMLRRFCTNSAQHKAPFRGACFIQISKILIRFYRTSVIHCGVVIINQWLVVLVFGIQIHGWMYCLPGCSRMNFSHQLCPFNNFCILQFLQSRSLIMC